MPYKSRINSIKNEIQDIEKKLKELKESGYDGEKRKFLNDTHIKLQSELSRLYRLQWENDHESVDYGDDR